MSPSPFWARLREARIVRIAVVYLAASWLVLQVADVLRNTFAFPAWVMPFTVLLLLVGLVIILATAWVQSHPPVAPADAVDAREVAAQPSPETEPRAELPGSWELGLRELGASIREGRLPHLTWARTLVGGVFAFSLLFGMAGLYVVIQDRGRSFAPAEAIASPAVAGVVVLPFEVAGADLAIWREGMVDVLSTNLNSVGALGAVSSRTVMARWREQVPQDATPDLETALAVARSAGGVYGVVGSVLATGAEVRLTAELHDAGSAAGLGRAQVQGPADDMLELVDQLSVQLARLLLRGTGIEPPSTRLASITTSSLDALQAYLEGESNFRRSNFAPAIAAYERAVQADSTFALAWYRIAQSFGWAEGIGSPALLRAEDEALRWVDRLPAKEAALVQANASLRQGTLSGIEPLRRLSQTHPDDPEVWYLLGDTYIHLGDQAMVDPVEAERALARAIALEPGFSPYHIHVVERMIGSGDSVRAREAVDRFAAIAGGTRYEQGFRTGFTLLYGDESARQRAQASLDTLPADALSSARFGLQSPHGYAALVDVERVLLDRPAASGPGGPMGYLNALLSAGRHREALAFADDARWAQSPVPGIAAYTLYVLGVAVPEARLDRDLEPGVPGAPGPGQVVYALVAGAYAAERGRWADHAAIVERVRGRAAELDAGADSLAAARFHGLVRALEGYALWRRGRTAEAIRELEAARRETVGLGVWTGTNWWLRYWLAGAHLELGQAAEAARYLESLQTDPYGLFRLAEVYEQLGRAEDARSAYATVLTAWRDADLDHPLVPRAWAALNRLSPDPARLVP